MVQLEGCFNHRQAGDADRLASEGIPPVLALDVQAGKTSIAEEHPRADCAHGTGESDLGTSASCLGTVPEVGNLRFAQDGAGLLALAARQPTTENLLAALANLCTESRAVPDCL
jgi:hypothetical protein